MARKALAAKAWNEQDWMGLAGEEGIVLRRLEVERTGNVRQEKIR